MHPRLPRFILVWFAVALILVIAPPLHWTFSGPQRMLGLPIALAYLLAAGVFATFGVVVAYFVDPNRGEA